MVSFNTMAAGLLRKAQVESAFSRFVSPTVAREVMSNLETVELSSKKVIASALFADIVGFTSISENLEPHAVATMLNEYFNYFSRGAEYYHGHIDKFMGDCAMVLFGVPESGRGPLFSRHRLRAAVSAHHRTRQSVTRGARPVPGAVPHRSQLR